MCEFGLLKCLKYCIDQGCKYDIYKCITTASRSYQTEISVYLASIKDQLV